MNTMTKDEMRACRRELISLVLQSMKLKLLPKFPLSYITYMIRHEEYYRYDGELQAYK